MGYPTVIGIILALNLSRCSRQLYSEQPPIGTHYPSAHPEENREAKWGSHSVEYYVTRNKDKLPVFVTTWMKLTGMILSETSMKFQDR